MAQVNLNIDELKGFLQHIISTNRKLQSENKKPVAVEVVGDSGIGKTSTILQVAEESGLDLVKLNLAQIEEIGDLVGFSTKEYQMYREVPAAGNTLNIKTNALDQIANAESTKKVGQWVDAEAVRHLLEKGWQLTGKKRTSYAAPEWIADKKAGGILLLDDWNRADSRFIQAVMELVDRQTYISWKLPQDWHIILTSNPDNGDYSVNSVDDAQRTRYITANLDFDIDCWAKWAEEEGIDSRCINFLLRYPEMVTKQTNARSITTFFNAISSFENFADHLPMVQMIGEGSVGEAFASTFNIFINNRLDKILSPKEMLHISDEKEVMRRMKEAVHDDNDNFQTAISSLLATRLANYSVVYSKDNTVNDKITERVTKLILSDFFTVDNRYMIVRNIASNAKQKFQRMLMNPEILKLTLE
jgi:hypothetical protein